MLPERGFGEPPRPWTALAWAAAVMVVALLAAGQLLRFAPGPDPVIVVVPADGGCWRAPSPDGEAGEGRPSGGGEPARV